MIFCKKGFLARRSATNAEIRKIIVARYEFCLCAISIVLVWSVIFQINHQSELVLTKQQLVKFFLPDHAAVCDDDSLTRSNENLVGFNAAKFDGFSISKQFSVIYQSCSGNGAKILCHYAKSYAVRFFGCSLSRLWVRSKKVTLMLSTPM